MRLTRARSGFRQRRRGRDRRPSDPGPDQRRADRRRARDSQVAYGTSLTIAFNAFGPSSLAVWGSRSIRTPGFSRTSSPLAETAEGESGITANAAIELDPGDGAGIANVGLPAVVIGATPSGRGQLGGLGGIRASMVSAASPAENLVGTADARGGGTCVVETSTTVRDPGEEGRGREDLIIPAPQRIDLMTVFRPLEGTAVGPMIDRLLEPMEYLGGGLPWLRGPTGWPSSCWRWPWHWLRGRSFPGSWIAARRRMRRRTTIPRPRSMGSLVFP